MQEPSKKLTGFVSLAPDDFQFRNCLKNLHQNLCMICTFTQQIKYLSNFPLSILHVSCSVSGSI